MRGTAGGRAEGGVGSDDDAAGAAPGRWMWRRSALSSVFMRVVVKSRMKTPIYLYTGEMGELIDDPFV